MTNQKNKTNQKKGKIRKTKKIKIKNGKIRKHAYYYINIIKYDHNLQLLYAYYQNQKNGKNQKQKI